jgi:molybdopterin molybdotransferase
VLEVAGAEALILARIEPLGTERVPLEAAPERVLREDVQAERDQPPFDRITMDGIAIAFADWAHGLREFRIAGTQAAGAAPLDLTGFGQCIEVMTGAVLPAGADTVIPVERLEKHDARVSVDPDARVESRQAIHARGSDRRAGAAVLKAGLRLGPTEVAVLASAGCSEVTVARLVNVAVVSTGDELVDVADPIEPWQIRSTNDRAIEASLIRHRLATVTRARLADDPERMIESIDRLHATHDALILSGGVSMGLYDFVPQVLEKLGAEIVFHRIAQRPGKPMWFGLSRDGKPLFALPGNPVSTLVCLTRYVLPALRQARGEDAESTEYAVLTRDVSLPAELTLFMPVVLASDDRGRLLAEPRPTNTSGDFISLAGTDGFVELPREQRLWPAGSVVRLFRW